MGQLTPIDIRDIIVDRSLGCPVYDRQGVLLLRSGVALTPDLRQRLLARGVATVLADAAEVERAAAGGEGSWLRAKGPHEPGGRDDAGGPTAPEPSSSEEVRPPDAGHAARVQALFARLGTELEETLAVGGSDVAGLVRRAAQQTGELVPADRDSTLDAVASHGRDLEIITHGLHVAALSVALGVEMGLDDKALRVLYYSGLLANVGMLEVPAAVRNAGRRLSPAEFVEIEKHVILSANRLGRMPGVPELAQVVVYQSHERPDGSGYPRGRARQSIHPFARVVQLADSYLALTSRRPHRPPLMPYAAMECLLKEAARHKIDPQALRALLRTLSLFPIGGLVALSDGSVGRVVRSNGESYAEPVVLRSRSGGGMPGGSGMPELVDLRGSGLSVVRALPTPGIGETGLSDEVLNPACFDRPTLAGVGAIGVGAV
jgi:HD-GYP domain-containing protein (c-di-GMP phosphodiesterase class II)